jgi:hypothetical protein
MNIRMVMNEEFDVIPSTEWMNEGLITLEKIKAGAKTPEQALELNLWVFRNFVLKSFEAITIAGKITKEEAELINQVIHHHFSEDLLNALTPAEINIMQTLLIPFLEKEEANVMESSDVAEDEPVYIVPAEWLKEAIATLGPVKRSCKDPVKAARLGNFVFSTFVYEAFYAINVRGTIIAEEVELVNEIFREYFDEHVYQLMPAALREEIETLLNPFIIESGVDQVPYRNVA